MARLWALPTPWRCATLASLLLGFPPNLAGAQITPGASGGAPAPTAGDAGLALWSVVVLGLAAVALVVAAVKFFDLRRRRESEQVHLQAQISDALLRERALLGIPVTPTARLPIWAGSPAVIELSGSVPSPELRETVLRLVRQEAARTRPDSRIEDRITVLPPRPVSRVA